jgi:hypothetical protein
MITQELKATFESQGLIRLNHLVPIEKIDRARYVVYQIHYANDQDKESACFIGILMH